MKKKKILVIVSLIIIILIFVFFATLNKKVATGVDITVAPSDGIIIIDNKKAHSGVNSLSTGTHTIEVKRDNFTSSTTDIDVIKNQVVIVPISLNPSNNEGEKIKSEKKTEFLALDGIISQQYTNQGDLVANAYPIIKDLPKDISPIFRIDYGTSKRYPNNPTKIALYISSDNPADKQAGLNYIYLMGYDPSDYEIIFEGL